MLLSKRTLVLTLVMACAGLTTQAIAEDAYYDIPLKDLTLLEGSLPKYHNVKFDWRLVQPIRPSLSLEQGEAYFSGTPSGSVSNGYELMDSNTRLLVRAPEGKDITGKLFVPNADFTGITSLPFKITASQAKPEAKQTFFQTKQTHYETLVAQGLPGEAWFRYQARLAQLALPDAKQSNNNPRNRWQRSGSSLEDTYDLFTGARAMSENLQLDRALPTAAANETPVKVDSLEGITVAEIDWAPLIKDAQPKLDPLASKIPFDQHVVFFPTFQAALAIADETSKHDTPVLRLAQPRSEDIGVVQRYERQLGLSTSTIARLLGPTLVKSAALTGSDLYFPMGTDIAILFESPQSAALETLLYGKIALSAQTNPQAKAVNGKVEDLAYRGFLSPNRDTSSYIVKLNNTVVVTNSLSQLERLAAVQKDKTKSLATLPEYIFFRTRYVLGDADETTLAFLSDAAIRRWCGPQWRIADSRRTRARAVLAELQASQVDSLVKKTVTSGPIHTDLPILGGGEGGITLEPTGVFSSTYGSLAFSTPISEMPLTEVTQAEANAYKNWRDNYQRNWRWGFDPIALRITINQQKLAADMTVMPLIFNTDYREIIRLSQGAAFEPTAGNPHDTLAQVIMAINRDSSMFKQGEGFASMMAPDLKNPFAWISNFVSIYADDDPFWKDLAAVKEEDRDTFMEKNISRLPVALQAGVANPLQLATFLTAARVFIEQSSPGMTQWELRKYKDHPYTCIVVTNGGHGGPPAGTMLCYTIIDKSLTITLNEKLLQRVIDRGLDRQQAEKNGKPLAPAKPWLGSNLALRADRQILEMANALNRSDYEMAMQRSCWNNLPILNEWRRLYPDRDPVAVHEQLWNAKLTCPGGGKYVWNDKYQTMESTVYGHPGDPKPGPAAPPVLSHFSAADFGLTLENNGLRARVEFKRDESR
ncbi:MAG: hypothetical protein FWD61_16570 [Phycisphaerales bacterium]|nr:hypothetical protein [Phycisphaerales bacterium]